jgi:hypothetical protein
MPLSLTLSIDNFYLSLTKFAENGYERMTASLGDVEYSLNGSEIETGSLYEPKLIWAVSAFVTAEQWRQLQAIYQTSDRKRAAQQPHAILIDDSIEPYVEPGSRTRAVVPGGAITLDGGLISYPARFQARIFEPKAEKLRNSQYPYLVRFTLKELDRIAP